MDTLLALTRDYTFGTVVLGCMLLGVISGVLGSFAVLRKQSLLGDGVSHCTLPGVVTAFFVLGGKSAQGLLLGALVSSLAAALLITGITRYTRVAFDSALALVMSVFFGLGLALLSYAQKFPHANQAGLNRFIFGQASALMRTDLRLMALCGAVLLGLVCLFWKELALFTFDSDFAHSIGFSPKWLNLLLSCMIVVSIIIGLQAVGVILMSALLSAPAIAARQWTNRLAPMVRLSAVFGAVCGVGGTAASSLVPALATGPAIVVCASILVAVSMLCAPGRGLLHGLYLRRKNRASVRGQGGAGGVPPG